MDITWRGGEGGGGGRGGERGGGWGDKKTKKENYDIYSIIKKLVLLTGLKIDWYDSSSIPSRKGKFTA